MQKVMGRFQIILLIVTFAGSLAGFFLLPETVAVQWNDNGVSNSLSRAVACWIPFIVNVICFAGWKISSVHFQTEIEVNKKFRVTYAITWGVAACIGIVLHLILFAAN